MAVLFSKEVISVKHTITEKLWQLICEDCAATHQPLIWKKPIVGFADANDPFFPSLRELIRPDHHLPQDFLKDAATVICWFVPFLPEIGKSNQGGTMPSEAWADAYNITNAMAARVGQALCQWIREMPGQDAALPADAGMLAHDIPWSLWSHRHAAYRAGIGTFGINNMLITEEGCVGRCFSLVTTLNIAPDPPLEQERCLYKRNGSCGLCVRHCPAGALTPSGFDRYACMEQLAANKANHAAATVCGKCLVGLPCSYGNPLKSKKE